MKNGMLFDFARPAQLLFCMDLANNHQGSVEHGIAIITRVADIVHRRGARTMMKLQLRSLETLLHPADLARSPIDGEFLSLHSKRFRETALTKDQLAQLVACARAHELAIYGTPFDEQSVDLCEEFGFEVIKVASCSAYDWPLLRRIARTQLPIIVSVGGLAVNEIDEVVDFFREMGNPLALLHCIAAYPTEVKYLQLDVIRQLKDRYPDLPVGYSGHETPNETYIGALAVAKGAMILERHVGIPTDTIKLNAYSMTPDQAEEWILFAERAAVACSNGIPRQPAPGERESLLSLKRGLYAKRTVPAGKTLTSDDVRLAMPCHEGQFPAAKYYEVVDSFTPIQSIPVDMPIGLNIPYILPRPLVLSSIIGRASEMLREAKVTLDDDAEAEISHHYGLERFFEVGAVIIDVVNRDYCKKIIVQFPNQHHPSHRHFEKEETFHVLSGTLDLVLNGQVYRLEAGQRQLVERGVYHSFSTKNGAIVEEISSTHVAGDSEYEDRSIPQSPAGRKTKIRLLP